MLALQPETREPPPLGQPCQCRPGKQPLTMSSSAVSVTKIRQRPQPPSQPSRHLSSVTVRPGRGSSFTPLATFLGAERQEEEQAVPPQPDIEIRASDEDNNQELPPGTKIITHPMINNSRAWDAPVVSRK